MRLILLTHFYPNSGAEPFLAYETQEYHGFFSSVWIAPLFNGAPSQPSKLKFSIFKPVFKYPKSKSEILFKGLFNTASSAYHRADFYQNWYKRPKTWHAFLLSVLVSRAIQSSKTGKRIAEMLHQNEPTLVYSYWSDHWTSALPYLMYTTSKTSNRLIVRSHGSDLVAVHQNGFRPFRALVLELCNYWYAISEHGKNYLIQNHPEFRDKIKVSRLGVPDRGRGPVPEVHDSLVVVSVSNVVPLKQVDKIFMLLQNLSESVVWHHFGDGEGMLELQQLVLKARSGLQVYLHGQVSTESLVKFYLQEPVHAFINLSLREGFPVSLMEAFSFGIPVYAAEVGGIPELVNPTNGYLVNPKASLQSLKFELETFWSNLKNNNSYRQQAVLTWQMHLSTNNYTQFLKEITD